MAVIVYTYCCINILKCTAFDNNHNGFICAITLCKLYFTAFLAQKHGVGCIVAMVELAIRRVATSVRCHRRCYRRLDDDVPASGMAMT